MKNRKPLVDVLGLVGSKPEVAAAGRRQEVARMTNTVLGVCPCCNRPMTTVLAAEDVQCYTCVDCCVCLPTADQ